MIRDPLQTAISAWSTLVRSGGYPLEELPPPDHPLLVDRCDHRVIVQRWLRAFPQLQVHIYAPDIVGLLRNSWALPKFHDCDVDSLVHNSSLSHRAIVEIARLNKTHPVHRGTDLNPEREQRVSEIIAENSGRPSFKASVEQHEKFASYFADSTAWVQRVFSRIVRCCSTELRWVTGDIHHSKSIAVVWARKYS